MKIIISQNQYDLLREQQSKPVQVNLYKDPDAVEKYCKPIKVDKEIIDSKIPILLGNLTKEINELVGDVIKKFPETKPFQKKFDKILVKIKPILESIVTKSMYSKFGYLDYTPNLDVKKVIDIIYSEILSELKNYKLVADVMITKKNVEDVRKQMLLGIERYSSIVKAAVMYPLYQSMVNVSVNFKKNAPKCKDVIVVVDGDLNKLKPNEQYHPKYPIYVNPEFQSVDFESLISPYIPKLNQIINSFV